MDDDERLTRLKLRFRPGCRERYQLRIWQARGFPTPANFDYVNWLADEEADVIHYRWGDWVSTADQLRIAEETLAMPDPEPWEPSPWTELRDHLIARLDDPDPDVRLDAACDLVEKSTSASGTTLGLPVAGDLTVFDLETASRLIPIFVARLRSPDCPSLDRAMAAGALARLGMPASAAIPILLAVLAEIDETHDEESGLLRYHATQAIDNLGGSPELLTPLIRRMLRDRAYCMSRFHAARLAKNVAERAPRFLNVFSPDIEPLLNDPNLDARCMAELFFDPNAAVGVEWG
jgi:hypothetical protein